MYKDFFQLRETPFSIAPNPHFLYLGRRHQEALAHLLYSIKGSSGFVLLTGEVGTGKTTLSRCLIEQIPGDVDSALIFNPKLTSLELVASICDDLDLKYPKGSTLKDLFDLLNHHLLDTFSKNRITVIILDEAQNLTIELLEQIRLLSNLETNSQKLLQIILIGQPELMEILAKPELRQLNQRITARYHILPFERPETMNFIQHRLAVAGCTRPVFNRLAVKAIHRAAEGTPRLINQICDRALLGAYTLESQTVSLKIARTAIKEVMGEVPRSKPRSSMGILFFLIFLSLILGLWIGRWTPQNTVLPARLAFLQPYLDTFFNQPVSKPAAIPQTAVHTPPISPEPVATNLAEPAAPNPSQSPSPNPEPPRTAPKNSVEEQASKALPTPPKHKKKTLRDRLDASKKPYPLWQSIQDLFRIWRIPESSVQYRSPCRYAETIGLACAYLNGNWNTIRHLNIPAVIQLQTRRRLHFASVTALNDRKITLQWGAKKEIYPLYELEHDWYGQYTVLWRPTPSGKKILRPGMQGTDIVWLRQRLLQIQGAPFATQAPELFDEEMAQRLQQWQRRVGLNPDGVMGMRSLIAMDLQLRDPLRYTPSLGRMIDTEEGED